MLRLVLETHSQRRESSRRRARLDSIFFIRDAVLLVKSRPCFCPTREEVVAVFDVSYYGRHADAAFSDHVNDKAAECTQSLERIHLKKAFRHFLELLLRNISRRQRAGALLALTCNPIFSFGALGLHVF